MAAEGVPFPWRWNGDTISLNLGVIWEMSAMDTILKYLLAHMSFLYKEFGFIFVDSMNSNSFGDGYLTLRSDRFELRFVSDRSQLFLDFRSLKCDKRNNWHSIDIVRQLITGRVHDSAILNDQSPIFLKENYNVIRELFSPQKAGDTVAKLKKLESERAKRLFG
ncbi:MAG: hypothetical protein ACU0DI_12730 [Paracoccaceae bacterium]